jgi:hypothetical protein
MAYWQEPDPDLLFTGMVGDNLFTLARLTPGFRNSFRPMLYGTILPETGGGACIRLALSVFPVAMMFAIVYPFYIFSMLLSYREQEFLVETVAEILEASDYPPGSVPSLMPFTPPPARAGSSRAGSSRAGSSSGAVPCVICAVLWALAWLMLIGPIGALLLIDGASFMRATVLGGWMLDGAALAFWFGGVAFFLYRAFRRKVSKTS